MNFHDLLSVAGNNKIEAEQEASIKRYSTEIGPAKKYSKSKIQSEAIKSFLAKKDAEEKKKAEEAQKKKIELLSLRAQSTKNNKKAKLMAARTKDNDFSRIKLTDDEVEAKKKREAELLRMSLSDTVQRMKARIDLEEKEKLLPRKRKRKSKENAQEKPEHEPEPEPEPQKEMNMAANGIAKKNNFNGVKRRPPPPPNSTMNFHDLLKMASTKQFQPVILPKVVKKDDRPLTKKEKIIQMEAEERAKRKLMTQTNGVPYKLNGTGSNSSVKNSLPNSKNSSMRSTDATKKPLANTDAISNQKKKPMLVRVCKDPSIQSQKDSVKPRANLASKPSLAAENRPTGSKLKSNSERPEKKIKEQSGGNSGREQEKVNRDAPSISSSGGITEEMLAMFEKRIRSQVQQEIEAKFKMHELNNKPKQAQPSSAVRTSEEILKRPEGQPKPVAGSSGVKFPKPPKAAAGSSSGVKVPKPPGAVAGPSGSKFPKPSAPTQKKPAFHINPYLQPPRRLLESQRPYKPTKRRIESESEEDEDDDMSDFIDDEPMHGGMNEDVSKHIKEIFGYDRSRYMYDDDDDIMESSFVDQMKEESRSARLGRLEDLEDMKMEEEMLKQMRKKKKLKGKGK